MWSCMRPLLEATDELAVEIEAQRLRGKHGSGLAVGRQAKEEARSRTRQMQSVLPAAIHNRKPSGRSQGAFGVTPEPRSHVDGN